MVKTRYVYDYEDITGEWYITTQRVACVVAGEFDNGRKVWEDVETGEQYMLYRFGNEELFVHV